MVSTSHTVVSVTVNSAPPPAHKHARVSDDLLQQAASSAAPANVNAGNGCVPPSSCPSHRLSLTAAPPTASPSPLPLSPPVAACRPPPSRPVEPPPPSCGPLMAARIASGPCRAENASKNLFLFSSSARPLEALRLCYSDDVYVIATTFNLRPVLAGGAKTYRS